MMYVRDISGIITYALYCHSATVIFNVRRLTLILLETFCVCSKKGFKHKKSCFNILNSLPKQFKTTQSNNLRRSHIIYCLFDFLISLQNTSPQVIAEVGKREFPIKQGISNIIFHIRKKKNFTHCSVLVRNNNLDSFYCH